MFFPIFNKLNLNSFLMFFFVVACFKYYYTFYIHPEYKNYETVFFHDKYFIIIIIYVFFIFVAREFRGKTQKEIAIKQDVYNIRTSTIRGFISFTYIYIYILNEIYYYYYYYYYNNYDNQKGTRILNTIIRVSAVLLVQGLLLNLTNFLANGIGKLIKS